MERLRDRIGKNLIEEKIILDVGTGPKSIEFLTSCRPSKVYAVSYSPDEITESQRVQPKDSVVEYIEWDLSSDKHLDIQKVDVVFAGYFLPALEGSRPGKLAGSLKRIKELLKDSGIIIIEDFYWLADLTAEQDTLARELYQITFDSKDLAGITYPIQMPESREVEILKEAGFNVLNVEKGLAPQVNNNFLTMHQRRVDGLKERVRLFKASDKPSGEMMIKRAEEILHILTEINKPPVFSYDYIIIAQKTPDTSR